MSRSKLISSTASDFLKVSSHMAVMTLAILSLTAITTMATAADFHFPADDYGKLNLAPRQTTGGNDLLLKAQKGGAFEPIVEFNRNDRYRKFSDPIARLDMLVQEKNGNKYLATCTANLIAPGVMLTNFHCIPGMNAGAKVIKASAVFDYLREDQEKDKAPRYKVDVKPLVAIRKKDFALIKVYGSPEKKFGYFRLKPRKVQPNQSLFIIHHPAGLPKRLTRFRCKAYSPTPYADEALRHRCDTLGGSSGSLIFDLDFEVVALHNLGGLTGSSRTSFNSGISIFSLMENKDFVWYVAGALRDSTNSPAMPSPAVPRPRDSETTNPAPVPQPGNNNLKQEGDRIIIQ